MAICGIVLASVSAHADEDADHESSEAAARTELEGADRVGCSTARLNFSSARSVAFIVTTDAEYNQVRHHIVT